MRRTLYSWLIAAVCAISLAAYLLVSQGFRTLTAGTDYFRRLWGMVFPNGFRMTVVQAHLPPLPSLLNGETLVLILFLLSCAAGAWMLWRLLGGRLDFLPALILLSLGFALAPNQLLGLLLWPDGHGLLTSAMLLAVNLALDAALGLTLMVRGAPKAQSTRDTSIPSPWSLLFLLPAAAVILLAFLEGASAIQGYDAQAYHLPLAAAWHKFGRLTTGFDIQYFLPGNAELLMRWLFLGSSDRLVFLVPFSATLLCLYMIYRISHALGHSKAAAIASACCALTFPVVPFLATVCYTDTVATLFLLLGAFFLLRWRDSGCSEEPAIGCVGLAIGLSAGTKMSMLPPAFAILLVAVWIAIRSPRFLQHGGEEAHLVGFDRKWLLRQGVVLAIPGMLGCCYWYIRNLLHFGNPFYPVGILGLPGLDMTAILPVDKAFGDSILPRLLYPWTELAYASPYDNGTGAVFAAIVVPALFLWWILGRKKEAGVVYAVVAGSILLFLWSNTTTPRYGLFAILIAFVLVGELWTATRSFAVRLVTFAAYAVAVFALAHALSGGVLYQYARGELRGAGRFGLPPIIDQLPSGRVLNANGAYVTYGLMGEDYRHEVVTRFGDVTPGDISVYHPDYVLLRNSQVPAFTARYPLTRLAVQGDFSLWSVSPR